MRSKTITSKAFDVNGNLYSTGVIENADLEGFLASLTSDMNEDALINAAIKAFAPMKVTKIESFTNQKKDIYFNGEFYPFALYLANNSNLSFYNSNEQAVLSLSQNNGVLSFDLKYPLSGKDMISFNVATTSNALENVKNQLTSVQSIDQIAQMAMFVPFSLLSQDYILHDLKIHDINGNVILKTNQLRFSPQKQTPYPTGTVTFTPSIDEQYDFTFDGTEQVKVFDKKENKTQTFQHAENFIGYLAGFSNQTLMQNTAMALKNEIEQIKPITAIEMLYWGGLMGYNHGYDLAMDRHAQNSILDYILKCAVVAQTQGMGTGPLPDDMNSCTELMMGEDSFGFKDSKVVRYDDGTLLIEVEKWADDEQTAQQVKERLTSDYFVVDGNNIWVGDKASIQKKKDQPIPSKLKENQPAVAKNNNTMALSEKISDEAIEEYIRKNPQVIADYIEKHPDVVKKEFYFDEKTIAEWVKENPELIIDTVNTYYKKQQATRPAAPKVADAAMVQEIMADKTNSVMGNPKGSFVMIEFFDYNCGYCKMMNKKMAEAIKKSDNIRWILIDTPIFGDKSEVISRYALAAGKQGKFAEFHAALEAAQDKTEAGLKEIGKKVGLNVAKLEKDANSDAIKNKIAKNKEYTKKLQMGGVPMFIIDGNIQGGAFQDDKMEEYIKKANEMKKAKK